MEQQMRIENLRSETRENRARIAATVIWEDCDRPTTEVHFETSEEFAKDLSCNPHAFLVGCTIPALYYGEERVFIDAEVCPELKRGLREAMSWLRHWYYSPGYQLVRIEAQTRANHPSPRTPERAGQFFSGGIDSLAALRANRLNYPLEHPGSIKDCLFIYGQNIESDNRLETFEEAARRLAEVAHDAGATLIPVYTNVRSLEYDTTFFGLQFHAAILASVAHAFARRLTLAVIASSTHHGHVSWGSHPLLDSHFGSSDLRIRHDSTFPTRFERHKLVADWDIALQNIKLCPPNFPGRNCGHCEKCLRTRLALLALGVLDRTDAFPKEEITPEQLKSVANVTMTSRAFQYGNLIGPLREIGRDDLAQVLESKLERYYDIEPGWKGRVKRFDRKYLGKSLTRFRRRVSR